MKVKNLAVLAVVASGAVALAAPSAFAADAQTSKSKSQQRTDRDIKRLGDNVSGLRKKDDEINGRIDSITAGLTPVLRQLGSAAESYANFQYGFVQLTFGAAGGPQTFFTLTPRLDPTQAQSTVTRTFFVPPSGASAGAAALYGRTLGAEVGVRSLNDPQEMDNKTTAFCGATISAPDSTSGVKTATTKSNPDAAKLPFYPIQRSSYKPKDPADELGSLVGAVTGDKTVNLLDNDRTLLGATSALTTPSIANGALGTTITVSLSCLAIDNQKLKDQGVTPPFAK